MLQLIFLEEIDPFSCVKRKSKETDTFCDSIAEEVERFLSRMCMVILLYLQE